MEKNEKKSFTWPTSSLPQPDTILHTERFPQPMSSPMVERVNKCVPAHLYMYSFSFFSVAMFYKVTLNTELENLEPLLLGEMQSKFPTSLLSQYFCQSVST